MDKSHHVEVNGVSLYVQERGEGVPIVLVHGGTVSSVTWKKSVALLAEHHHVVVFDSRGHGGSTNPSRELTYELIADDTVALIDALRLDRPIVGGWSDGGQVALEVGLRHAGIARALVPGGAMHDFGDAFHAVTRKIFCLDANDKADFNALEASAGPIAGFLKGMHKTTPTQWQDVAQQSADMWLGYGGLDADKLARINEPSLVVAGDRDELIPLGQTIDIFEWLPNAELAILPGQDHNQPLSNPRKFMAAIVEYAARL